MSCTQRIFAVARPGQDVTWEDITPHMQSEAAHVWALYEQDVLRDAWVRTDSPGAVYVLESTPAAAAHALAGHPMTARRLAEFELVPVGPFTLLSLLFGTQESPVPARAPIRSNTTRERVLALGGLRPNVDRSDLSPHLAAEARHAWSLWKDGVIRESYLRTDGPGAVLVLEAAGPSAGSEILDDLPLVRAGLIDFECLSLAAFMGYDALLDGSLDETYEDPAASSEIQNNPKEGNR